ncbi:hypothetical protein NQ117_15430 [Paenibacillus sp. SC116]|uniref:hypothetical protein n=1 Tax=Paenibacillus sp. SC116 TaxID=2968986 RepID=UPI00215AD2D3|nr:hypothetical protein [Paenibacillus sp. SC116]MCR8845073.1 hypothetical protein [Paenibacillus sp. SC116]
MEINQQIIVALLIIIFVFIIIQFAIISKYKTVKNKEIGLEINEKIPNFDFGDIKGRSGHIDQLLSRNIRLLIMLDGNCEECSKVINLLKAMDTNYLEEIKLVLVKAEYNYEKMAGSVLEGSAIYVEPTVIFDRLRVNSFPYYLKVNDEGKVISKGHALPHNVIDLVTSTTTTTHNSIESSVG